MKLESVSRYQWRRKRKYKYRLTVQYRYIYRNIFKYHINLSSKSIREYLGVQWVREKHKEKFLHRLYFDKLISQEELLMYKLTEPVKFVSNLP